MNEIALIFGAIFGGLSIILGAFGAHKLKQVFTPELLQSFEIGVKYQMYHAIVLLVLGFNLDINAKFYNAIIWCFIIGVILFSFSIYGLCFSSSKGKKLKFLGPITPIGGLFFVAGWLLFLISLISK
ncbi:MAG: DUF423 domain-containing protein [Winogradskyella sp.]|uniref:DUF423 domain-containing protein n=1 Tax=Winogradskyella sp. TaxID=1883156 RepID=UPI0025DF4A5D|nr:DUF423 domain-containing protein [Winogradskyella sp.]NRB59455.1 DUF423 domain-containing protein [Winogradskyella sp.]